jgi:hypothetical protein
MNEYTFKSSVIIDKYQLNCKKNNGYLSQRDIIYVLSDRLNKSIKIITKNDQT